MMTPRRARALLSLAAALFLLLTGLLMPGRAPAAAKPPVRAITKIAGDLYRFRNNFHYSVFYVTPAGIIATDPINPGAARWLKAELKKRFNKPVKYLIYSHDHRDHIAGGEVFADTAVVVAHDLAKAAILGERRPTAVPHVTFTEEMTIELGGKVVELTHAGRNHSNNSIVMRFPAERALFAVDFIPVKAVAYRDLPDAYLPEWMDSLRLVETLDFDILVPGHGPLGTKADVTAFREYMDELYEAVLAGARAGKSVGELKKTIRMEKYKSWFRYKEFLPLNIEGMYNRIQHHRRGN